MIEIEDDPRRPSADRHDPARSSASRHRGEARPLQGRLRRPPHSISPSSATAGTSFSSPALCVSISSRSSPSRRPIGSAGVSYDPFIRDFSARGRGRGRPRKPPQGAQGFSGGQQPQGRLAGHRERAQRGAGQCEELVMMSPYGAAEKQALLEAPDCERSAPKSWSPSRKWSLPRKPRAARRRCSSDRIVHYDRLSP